jgi:hypothetical protein
MPSELREFLLRLLFNISIFFVSKSLSGFTYFNRKYSSEKLLEGESEHWWVEIVAGQQTIALGLR